MTRPKPEIRLMVEFLWRTLFGYNNFLEHKQKFNRDFSEGLGTGLAMVGLSILHQMHLPDGVRTQTADPEILEKLSCVFESEYNKFCYSWREITDQWPEPMRTTKVELAAAGHIDQVTESIFSIYQNQEA